MQSKYVASTAFLCSSDSCFIPSAVDASPDSMDPDELPDLTDELQSDRKTTVGTGSFGVVYRCPRTAKAEVSVFTHGLPANFTKRNLSEGCR